MAEPYAIHELKADPAPFNDVLVLDKRCEVRRDDRGFRKGDILHLREFDRDAGTYSGRECWRVVTHIQRDYGLPDGLVVLSIMPTVDPTLTKRKEAAKLTRCAAARDGDCIYPDCPQLRDGESAKSRRHCPLDTDDED